MFEKVMVNDWVYIKEERNGKPFLQICKVYGLDRSYHSRPRIIIDRGDQYIGVPAEFVEPVPLTDQILKNSGFQRYQKIERWGLFDEDGNCEFCIEKEGEGMYCWLVAGVGVCGIMHVHKLQQAMRLARVRKEIVP